MQRKSLSELFREVDPNLKVISRHRATKKDWDRAGGEKCVTCGTEILQTHGPLKQCRRCLYREKGMFLEETICAKCKERAVLVTALSNGLQESKVVCPNCGTKVFRIGKG